MAMLDSSKASQWGTLGLYTKRRGFPNAINARHRKYLEMFDAWLDRLQAAIIKFESENSENSPNRT